MTTGMVPIADLVDLCERMAAANRQLFELLGSWVADEPDPTTQRHFAVACHRHAWHAELWSERRPEIPVDAAPIETLDAPSGDRAGWYDATVRDLQQQLQSLEAGIDPILDPSTQRVIHLVAADLADLIIP